MRVLFLFALGYLLVRGGRKRAGERRAGAARDPDPGPRPAARADSPTRQGPEVERDSLAAPIGEVRIALNDYSDGGYHWELASVPSGLTLLDITADGPAGGARPVDDPGNAAGQWIFRLQAAQPGTFTLRFELLRFDKVPERVRLVRLQIVKPRKPHAVRPAA